MQLSAPAKINLSLKVLARRGDGFHEIETLMLPISLRDVLTIEKKDQTAEVEFQSDDSSIPSGEDNLVVRAARAFMAAASVNAGVRITLQKHIPHGAGLGGGSSDAAATLLGLDQLFATALDPNDLLRIAAEIGSDVAFFILRSAAICRGRGELVTSIDYRPALPLLLLKPAFLVPTGWAYSRWRDSSELTDVDYRPQELGDRTLLNDLERPVFQKYVFLAQLKSWLRGQQEVLAALLSGSGSTVFAVLRNRDEAQCLGERAKAELDPDLWTCACETIGL